MVRRVVVVRQGRRVRAQVGRGGGVARRRAPRAPVPRRGPLFAAQRHGAVAVVA